MAAGMCPICIQFEERLRGLWDKPTHGRGVANPSPAISPERPREGMAARGDSSITSLGPAM